MTWRNDEPTLDEILSDTGTRALMGADGVRRQDLEAMLHEIGRKLAPELGRRSRCTLMQFAAC